MTAHVTADQIVELIALMQQQVKKTAGTTKMKTKQPDWPVINAGTDDREWALFEDAWSRYKKMIGVTSAEDAETIRMSERAAQLMLIVCDLNSLGRKPWMHALRKKC